MRQASWISAMRSGVKPRRERPIFVDAGEAQRIVADDDVGREVLTEERAALNHRVRTDVGPLVDGRMAADHDPVADMHLARERNAVGDDATAADHAVVAYVHVGHQQVAVADARGAGRGRAAADGDVFADVVVVADLAEGSSPANLRSCGRHEIEAAVWIRQRLPMRAPSWITAPGPIRQPSPITTSPAMHAKGSTMTLSPSFASG